MSVALIFACCAARPRPSPVCLLRITLGHEAMESKPQQMSAAVMECTARAGDEADAMLDVEILDLDFFDDEALVLVVRTKEPPGARHRFRFEDVRLIAGVSIVPVKAGRLLQLSCTGTWGTLMR